MKKLLLILPVFLLALAHLSAQTTGIIYVKAGSIGDGTSWATAYGDLQLALRQARPNQQIWVAAGIYYPTMIRDRSASFVVPDAVRLYGGFAGYETTLDQRNWRHNVTILSGEIGSEDSNDNSYTVVYTERVSPATIIDGFAITGGVSDGVNNLGDIQRCGAGLYNNGENGNSSPTIVNCLFMNNYARDGAAIYNYANGGACNPKVINCQFVGNKADLDGGAIFNDTRNGSTLLEIEKSLFTGNTANFGASINTQSDNGQAQIVLKDSAFESNVSYVRNIINNNGPSDENYHVIKQGCRFTDNISVVGDNLNKSNGIVNKQPTNTYRKNTQISYLRF